MKSVTLKKKIHDEIMDMIMRNRFPMTEFLKEGELAEMFHVSKAPVREALIELCNENIIRNIPRSGYQILQLTERDFREAIQFRIILETQGLSLSKERMTSRQLEALESTIVDTSIPGDMENVELSQWWEYNIQFHIGLVLCANNSLLTKALNDTLNLLRRINMQLFWNETPETYLTFNSESHKQIFHALEKHDFDMAEKLLISDINSIHDTMLIS